jgi:hypothetical protein
MAPPFGRPAIPDERRRLALDDRRQKRMGMAPLGIEGCGRLADAQRQSPINVRALGSGKTAATVDPPRLAADQEHGELAERADFDRRGRGSHLGVEGHHSGLRGLARVADCGIGSRWSDPSPMTCEISQRDHGFRPGERATGNEKCLRR